jgi:protein phosphatase
MSFQFSSAARATTGARSGQEDAFRVWPAEGVVPPKAEGGGLLAVLADGMGGHTGGAVAGQTACKTFAEVFATADSPLEARLSTALQASNEALAKGVEQNASLRGMGCTLVAAWFDDAGIRWTSVGDSLLLLYRAPELMRLNADHSLGFFLDEQARQNRISRSEARRNRNRNALRSALTGSKIDLIDLRADPCELRAGDWVVLASDGICSLAGDEIADVIYRFRQSTPEEMADGLIAAVTQKAIVDQDNTTVVCVRIEEAKPSADDVTTRIVMRPKKSQDAELRTRRIGVSRPVRAKSRSRKAAGWLAMAAALLISAAVVMLALPMLRSTVTTTPDTASAPGEKTLAVPAKAGIDQAPPATLPAAPSPRQAKPAEGGTPPAEKSSERQPAEKSAPDGDDTSEGKRKASAAPPTATTPAQPPGAAGVGEEGATGSPGAAKAPAPGPGTPAAKPAGEKKAPAKEEGTARPSPPAKSAATPPPAVPAPPPDESAGTEETGTPRAAGSKASAGAKSPATGTEASKPGSTEGGAPAAARPGPSKAAADRPPRPRPKPPAAKSAPESPPKSRAAPPPPPPDSGGSGGIAHPIL